MTSKQKDKYTPDWAKRAEHIPHKPEWVDFIPHELWRFGDVFFPLPRRKKYTRWAFHLSEERFSADDEILNAYLEAGCGYGIVCAGDLIVIDIDEKEYASHITDLLDESMWQVTGSREGYHIFYECEDLDTRIVLRIKLPESHIAAEGLQPTNTSKHIGEVKADPHEYVVGPGSVHPSGNTYGPLKGDNIEEVDRGHLEECLDQYIVEEDDSNDTHYPQNRKNWDVDEEDLYEFYKLSVDDVLPWLERGKNIAHPVHGSTTGQNFRKSESHNTFVCWRCQYGSGPGCGLNPQQFLAAEATGTNCETIRSRWRNNPILHYESWSNALDKGLIEINYNNGYKGIPYKVLQGYALKKGLIDGEEGINRNNYWNILNALVYEHTYET